ncbi:MAG: hypothetical protein ACHQ1H_12400 [Nitrososphaerales archaeon]
MQQAAGSSSTQNAEDHPRDPDREAERNALVAKAVVTGLGYFGAGQVVESLVYILELEHSVDMNSIADNIDGLRSALSKMFGGAARVVETKIAEALGKQLGVDSEGKSIETLIAILDRREAGVVA